MTDSKCHFDMSKLRGRIVEVYGTQSEFARSVGNSSAYVSQVLTGKSYMDQTTIERWRSALKLEVEDIGAYFFARKVDETQL